MQVASNTVSIGIFKFSTVKMRQMMGVVLPAGGLGCVMGDQCIKRRWLLRSLHRQRMEIVETREHGGGVLGDNKREDRMALFHQFQTMVL
ncbi:hypothetical protein Hanom_Chr06g00517071 [Helianthus anomalus]